MTAFIIIVAMTLAFAIISAVSYIKAHAGFYDCDLGRNMVIAYGVGRSLFLGSVVIISAAVYFWGFVTPVDATLAFTAKYF